jgi:hypothetical protein
VNFNISAYLHLRKIAELSSDDNNEQRGFIVVDQSCCLAFIVDW